MGLFDAIVQATLSHEGGSKLNTRDGEYSKYGVTKKWNPEVDVENLTEEGAKKVYRKKYWEKPHIDDLEDESANVAAKVFDMGVNLGQKPAILILQKTLKDAGYNVDVDGVIGPQTEEALKNAVDSNGDQGILSALSARQMDYYKTMPEKLEANPGWVDRASYTPNLTPQLRIHPYGPPVLPNKPASQRSLVSYINNEMGGLTPKNPWTILGGPPGILLDMGLTTANAYYARKMDREEEERAKQRKSLGSSPTYGSPDQSPQQQYEARPRPPLAPPTQYTIQRGDTLSQIAQRLGIPMGDLAQANGISDPNRIQVGQVLNLAPPQQMPTPSVSPIAKLQQQAQLAQVQPTLDPFPWLKETGKYNNPNRPRGSFGIPSKLA
jgi:LysM repeat protein